MNGEVCTIDASDCSSLSAVRTLEVDIISTNVPFLTVCGNFRCSVQHFSAPSMMKNSSSSRAHANSCQRFVDIHIPPEGSHEHNTNNTQQPQHNTTPQHTTTHHNTPQQPQQTQQTQHNTTTQHNNKTTHNNTTTHNNNTP